MSNYIVARCPECDKWGACSTQKEREDAIYCCRGCGRRAALMNKRTSRAGNSISASELDVRYFGQNPLDASRAVRNLKMMRLA